MIDTDKHEKILKDYEYRMNELLIYTDRSEEHPLGAYKFRQKDWQVRRFINDAIQAGWTLSSMKEIYDEAMEEVKRLREITDYVKECIDYHYHCIDNMTGGFIDWMEFARELHDMFYGDEEE